MRPTTRSEIKAEIDVVVASLEIVPVSMVSTIRSTMSEEPLIPKTK